MSSDDTVRSVGALALGTRVRFPHAPHTPPPPARAGGERRYGHEEMSELPLEMRLQLGAASRLHHARHGGIRLPHVDWSRHHLQVLLLDSGHGIKSRLAEAVFDSIARWNGFGRAVVPTSAGLIGEGAALTLGWSDWRAAALLPALAESGLDRRVLLGAALSYTDADSLEGDLSSFDVVVPVDEDTAEALGRLIRSRWPVNTAQREWAEGKVVPLQGFSNYCHRDFILRGGGSGILLPKMRRVVSAAPGGGEGGDLFYDLAVCDPGVADRDPLSGEAQAEAWNVFFARTVICVAGLVLALLDLYPADLEEQHFM